ncbi:transcriptional regulator with XRE-family HTH domain [Clostridium tetanomorphum]|uniref:Helix-turn-helix domain-containing protein n=1 Tax=Clostridium tetanomorphum TaxID=1553 RepID=A0A923J2S1_CLOTT|nr:helix-turn-helix domain-containing protein [Clostridium tetanomorphum]KAJ50045.1 hypothetical protein CTM_20159 [Clostridium tetanomorphum DSM 665]KAJ51314.1 hypothetical protein CTM_13481 [Clostridium tetanomorphum DSM 665]MBC2398978.1 helix-turn-helix domain-containing protein [Clostridium tetanomorphum]MBP1866184.1 transcriptional regulator with XRE-family HTH domain [Clostridium tetanomorphum]NRS86624.1 transcriptional regulator with XRE-family HTH domain [Clostridium tetanomorphum]
MNIGDRIKSLRKNNGLTQSDLANMIKKSTITIRKYESGDITPPLDVLNNIAKVLGVTVNDLLEFDVKLENGVTASYSFKNRIPNIDKIKAKSLSENELEKRRIAYLKKLYEENPNDKKISTIYKKINSTGVLSDEDIEFIDSYKQAEYVNNALGGDLLIIPSDAGKTFDLFKQLLISFGYTEDEIAGNTAYLFKKIKAQIELEMKMLEDENK